MLDSSVESVMHAEITAPKHSRIILLTQSLVLRVELEHILLRWYLMVDRLAASKFQISRLTRYTIQQLSHIQVFLP